MQDKKQDFTRREIEIDLKNVAKRNIYTVSLLFVIGLLTTALWIGPFTGEEALDFISTVCLLISGTLTTVLGAVLVYCLIMYFKPIKYEVVTDSFQYMEENAAANFASIYISPIESLINLGNGSPALIFKTYGEYKLLCDHNVYYYKWSNMCRTRGREMRQCAFKGDEYYLIIINNRIAYIYSKRVFEFKETEKA